MSDSTRTPFGLDRLVVDTPRGRLVGLRGTAVGVSSRRCLAIMVNGLVDTKDRWAAVLRKVSGLGYEACAYDHIGQFESDGPDEADSYTVEAAAEDLRALLDHVSPDRPVHLVGSCFGGFVVRDLAARLPHRVRSMTLIGSGLSMAVSSAPTLHEHVASTLAAGGVDAMFDFVRDEAPHAGVPRRTIELVRSTYLATKPGFLTGFSRSIAGRRFDAPPLAAGVAVLVVYGSYDGMWPAPTQRVMGRRLGARVEVIEGAGHSTIVTHPQTTADVLTRFWQEAERQSDERDESAPVPAVSHRT